MNEEEEEWMTEEESRQVNEGSDLDPEQVCQGREEEMNYMIKTLQQAQRSKIFRIPSEITECVAVTNRKGQHSFNKRKTGECTRWNANGFCSEGESCSFLHTRASGKREITAKEAVNSR